MRKTTSLLTLSVLATLTACGDEPPTPAELRKRVAEDLGNVLSNTKSASDGGIAGLPGAISLAGLGGRSPMGSMMDDLSLDYDTDAAIAWLNDKLFTDANHLGDGIYKVPAELVCSRTDVDPNGNDITTVDPDCAQKLELAQLRVRVEADDSALRFAIQVDADHDEPIAFVLRHDEVSITVDLDSATKAMLALAPLFGQEAPNAALAGRVTGTLKLLGASHARISLEVERAVSIKFADQGANLDGDTAFRLTSAVAHVISIELDGTAQVARLDAGLGPTTVHIPGDELDPATDLDLPGATVNATYQDGQVTLDNISLGARTTTLSVGGQQAIAIDLNANAGRKLSAAITTDALGVETLSVTPKLDLAIAQDHSVLGDDPGIYDVTRVQLDGAISGSDTSDQIRVLAGTFAISTNPAQYGFSANANQCVTATEVYDDVTFDSYTTYAVGACN